MNVWTLLIKEYNIFNFWLILSSDLIIKIISMLATQYYLNFNFFFSAPRKLSINVESNFGLRSRPTNIVKQISLTTEDEQSWNSQQCMY